MWAQACEPGFDHELCIITSYLELAHARQDAGSYADLSIVIICHESILSDQIVVRSSIRFCTPKSITEIRRPAMIETASTATI